MRKIVGVLVAVLISMTIAGATLMGSIEGNYTFGHVDKETYGDMVGYILDGDEDLFWSVLGEEILKGKATMFDEGEQVYMLDTDLWANRIQVRRPGETTKYWTSLEKVRA